MCVVYWIHLPEHVDYRVEGYIGVTQHMRRRKYLHKYSNENFNIKRFKNSIIMDAIFEGTEEECYNLEAKLRPSAYIGWNIVPGGGKPPSWLGKKHKPETIEKMRKAKLGVARTEQAKENMRGIRKTEEHKLKLSDFKRKLNESQCCTIKTRLHEGERVKILAEEFNVCEGIIYRIKRGIYPKLN